MSSISRQAALGVVGQILASLDSAYTGFGEVVDAVTEASANARGQLEAFVKIDFNPKFKTRVISIPSAIEGVQELWDEIRSGLLDKFIQLAAEFSDLLKSIKTIPPRAPGEPILQRTALILQFIHATNTEIASIVRQLLDLATIINDIKNRIETLDDLFLANNSKRTTVDVAYSKRNA
jgi:hypothetical protein